MKNNSNASARERSPGSVKLLTKGRLVGAALVALFLIVATACGADQEDYFSDLFGGDKEEFAFGWYDTPTADGAVSPIDAGIPVAKSQGLAVQLRPGEVALARMYDNYDKNKTVAVSAPDDFYVMPPKTANPSFEIFNYETNQRETLATEYYRETYYYIMALTPGAEATVTGSIGQYQTKDLKITCTGDDIFAPQTYKFDKRPHSFEIEGYGDVSFSLTYKRDGIQVAAGDVILPGTHDVEIGINNAYFKDLKLTKT